MRVSDGPMTRRPLIPAVVAATVALAPAAAAQAPPPTLQWDRQCYTEHQPMTFTGTGFTPAGRVDLLFSRPGFVYGSFEMTADAAGAYKVFLSTEAAKPSSRGTWRNVHVVRKASASTAEAVATRMHRVP